MVVMKGLEYGKCVFCGRKRVGPTRTNPLRYPKNKVCPACTRLPDFDKKNERIKQSLVR